MNPELILIFIYLFGRSLFYDINLVVNSRVKGNHKILQRSLLGLIALFLTDGILMFFLVVFFHEILILFDSLVKPQKIKLSRTWYFGNMFTALILLPLIIHFIKPILPEYENPVILLSYGFIHYSLVINMIFTKISLNEFILIASGYLFTLKEGTILIRLTLNRMRAIPKKKDKPTQKDQEEYDRGKLIGLLERTFLYFLIIFNQIGAIAIIIALKSLARFKELEDKNFAEYFLIGSFLSLLMGVIPAIIVRIILN